MDESSPVNAFILGVLQGITEFLPVSSSAHLVFFSWVLGGKTMPLTLNIGMHLGTLLAVLIFFWRDWLTLATNVIRRVTKGERSFESDMLFPCLIIGSIPAGVIGILWEDEIEAIFHHPTMVVAPLIIIGILIWWVDKTMPSRHGIKNINLRDAFLIGVAQACALIPGFSRSGSTIMGARLLKYERYDAARFSFLLGTPAMLGAALLNAKGLAEASGQLDFYVGIVTSAVVGCLSIKFLLSFLKKYGFGIFALYRIGLAIFILSYHI